MPKYAPPLYKQVKATDFSIECHDNAIRAWRCWRSLSRQFSPQTLPPDIIQQLQRTEPIHVITGHKNGAYKFISGFPSVLLVKRGLIKDVHLCVYKRLAQTDIEQMAWMSVLKTILFDLDKNIGLASLYSAINNQMPAGMVKEIFGRKNLSMLKLGELTNTTDSAIRHQIDRLEKPVKETTPMLERILNHTNEI